MDFLQFLLANWYYIVSILLLIASVIVAIVRKRASFNVNDAVMSKLFDKLPVFINTAEISGATGKEKLAFVVKGGLDFVKSCFGVSLSTRQLEYWTSIIKSLTESILSTPHKKG